MPTEVGTHAQKDIVIQLRLVLKLSTILTIDIYVKQLTHNHIVPP